MKLYRFLAILGLTLATATGAMAQFDQTHEIGVWGGITNYFGDLNTKASFKCARQGQAFSTAII